MRFDNKLYGARIRQLRIRRGLTQEQLAEKLNVSGTYIVKIESNQRTGSVEFAVELANAAKGHPWLFVRYTILSDRIVRWPLKFLQRPMRFSTALLCNAVLYVTIFQQCKFRLSTSNSAEIAGVMPFHNIARLNSIVFRISIWNDSINFEHPTGHWPIIKVSYSIDPIDK